MNEININDEVRSFDFDSRDLEGEAACFVEGIVTDLTHFAGCYRYDIQVTRRVYAGEEVEVKEGERVLHKFNGAPTPQRWAASGVEQA